MKKTVSWIRSHQLASFFLLAFLFTWIFLIPYLITRNEQSFGVLILIGLSGPAFANMIISRIISPPKDRKFFPKGLILFAVSWMISTAVMLLHIGITSRGLTPPLILLSTVLSLIPAWIISSAHSRYPEIRKSLSSFIKPKGHILWYLFALLYAPLIKLIALPLNNLFGWQILSQPEQTGNIYLVVIASILYELFFAGGLNEETGWTGFALPRLQSKFSPFISSIILWFFWNLWHIPMYIGGLWNADINSLIMALIGSFFARFVFTWLYNKTKGDMIPAILLHVMANASFLIFPATYVSMGMEAFFAIGLIMIARMWKSKKK